MLCLGGLSTVAQRGLGPEAAGVIRSTGHYCPPNRMLLKYTEYSNSSGIFLLDGRIPFGFCGTSLCKVNVVRFCALERIWAMMYKEREVVPHIGAAWSKLEDER